MDTTWATGGILGTGFVDTSLTPPDTECTKHGNNVVTDVECGVWSVAHNSCYQRARVALHDVFFSMVRQGFAAFLALMTETLQPSSLQPSSLQQIAVTPSLTGLQFSLAL